MKISASVRIELIEDLLTYETSIKTDIFLSLGNVEVLNLEKKNVKLQIGETLTDNLGFGCSCIAILPKFSPKGTAEDQLHYVPCNRGKETEMIWAELWRMETRKEMNKTEADKRQLSHRRCKFTEDHQKKCVASPNDTTPSKEKCNQSEERFPANKLVKQRSDQRGEPAQRTMIQT